MVRVTPDTTHHDPTTKTQPNSLSSELVAAALGYASTGWPVFPLRPQTKRPATPDHTAGRCDQTDPRCAVGHTGWEQRATTDHARITKAWNQHRYGIGIACGPARLVVIDFDVSKHAGTSGAESLRQLEHEHGRQLPPTFTVATPSGGRHLYYTTPPGQTFNNTAGRVAPCIDTRGSGGYVAAPPTRLPNGSYHIIDDHPPVELPRWFADLLNPPKQPADPGPTTAVVDCSDRRVSSYVAAAIANELDKVTTAHQGQRNHTLYTASAAIGGLVAAGLYPAAQAAQALEQAAAIHIGTNRFTITEASRTIASGLTRGQQQPRQLPHNLTTTTKEPRT